MLPQDDVGPPAGPVEQAVRGGVGQAGELGDGEPVHVGAQQDARPVAVREDARDARPADPSCRVPPATQSLGDDPGGPVLGERELGVPVEVGVDVGELGGGQRGRGHARMIPRPATGGDRARQPTKRQNG